MYDTGTSFDPRPESGSRGVVFVLGIAALVGAGYIAGRGSLRSAVPDADARQILYYVDPMHPAYRSDRPGKAPDCGMDLEPVYAGSSSVQLPSANGTVHLTRAQEETIRLGTELAQMAVNTRILHTAGRVVPDEGLTYRVSAGVDGWVRRLFSDRTGNHVKRGDALAAFFSKDISAPQQAYLYALESYERSKQMPASPADPLILATQQLAASLDNLRFLGMGEKQIEELGQTRREIFDVNVTAPGDGQILERHMAVGQRFMKGDLLYRIANLQRVWVLADVYPGDPLLLDNMKKARITITGMPPLDAEVAAAPPQFDEQKRTGTLRIELNNPNGSLVPGMIVGVDLEVPARSAITVHADAVIDSGATKRVFVALGDGQYELRDVETGWQEGDRVEIRSGLKAGERVVTAGAFLLDSESRMKNELQSINRHNQ